MAWTVASLEFSGDGCPAARHVPAGDELTCLNPLAAPDPVGTLDRPPKNPWATVACRGDRWIARMPGASCEGCPVRNLPSDRIVLETRVRDGKVHGQVAFPSVDRLADVVAGLRAQGQPVRLRRLRNGAEGQEQAITVQLGRLTSRQRTVLREAFKLDYFEPGSKVTLDDVARALGLGRSTVHEHLQKALRSILDECLGP